MYNHTQPAVWCGTFDGGVAFVALHCSCYSAAFKVQFFFFFSQTQSAVSQTVCWNNSRYENICCFHIDVASRGRQARLMS